MHPKPQPIELLLGLFNRQKCWMIDEIAKTYVALINLPLSAQINWTVYQQREVKR